MSFIVVTTSQPCLGQGLQHQTWDFTRINMQNMWKTHENTWIPQKNSSQMLDFPHLLDNPPFSSMIGNRHVGSPESEGLKFKIAM